MSDPIRDLENLKHEGMNVNPLPASEVRRRGTRMRRRNNALAAVGALAVVAVIATPLAVVARGGDHAGPGPVGSPSPSPTQTVRTDWLQTIPGDSRLGHRAPDSATFPLRRRRLVVDDLDALRGADVLHHGRTTRSARRSTPPAPSTASRDATSTPAAPWRSTRTTRSRQGPRRGPPRGRDLPGRHRAGAAPLVNGVGGHRAGRRTTRSSSRSRRRWTRTSSPTSPSSRSSGSATRSTWRRTTPAPAARRSPTPRCGGWPSGRRPS